MGQITHDTKADVALCFILSVSNVQVTEYGGDSISKLQLFPFFRAKSMFMKWANYLHFSYDSFKIFIPIKKLKTPWL